MEGEYELNERKIVKPDGEVVEREVKAGTKG